MRIRKTNVLQGRNGDRVLNGWHGKIYDSFEMTLDCTRSWVMRAVDKSKSKTYYCRTFESEIARAEAETWLRYLRTNGPVNAALITPTHTRGSLLGSSASCDGSWRRRCLARPMCWRVILQRVTKAITRFGRPRVGGRSSKARLHARIMTPSILYLRSLSRGTVNSKKKEESLLTKTFWTNLSVYLAATRIEATSANGINMSQKEVKQICDVTSYVYAR